MTPRLGTALAAVVLGVAFAACSSGATGSTSAGPTAEANSPTITAIGLKFDRTELDVPAGRPFTLVFDNRDTAPHNLAIYRDAGATTVLFRGEVFSGPGSHVYAVPVLPAGTWFFRCDVHTDMQGQVVASGG